MKFHPESIHSTCLKLAVCCLAILALAAAPAFGQTATAGTVTGQVVDEQNAAVPGAQVRIVEPTTNTAQSTVTNDAGRYIFSTVPPGTYNMTFTKQGFSSHQ